MEEARMIWCPPEETMNQREKQRGYQKKYREANRELLREKNKAYKREHREEIRKKKQEWNRTHRKRYQINAEKAAQRKIPLKEKCDVCGSRAVERHHPDYTQPLIVLHVCHDCHQKIHYPQLRPSTPAKETKT
jgi:hypothetical protein